MPLDLNLQNMIIIIFLIYNFVVFFIYGFDKMIAGTKMCRISEKRLLILTLLGGSLGALMGMHIFHHKTRKTSFNFWIYFILFVQLTIIFSIYYLISKF